MKGAFLFSPVGCTRFDCVLKIGYAVSAIQSRRDVDRGGERPMAAQSFPFKIGEFECLVVSDGVITVPDMVTPKPFNPNDAHSGMPMDVNCLLIRAGKRTILVDTGSGHWMGPASGRLVQNLGAAGIKPSDIDTVIITHAHGDHIGANVDDQGKPVFPRARYVMHRKEWEHWTAIMDAEPENPRSMLLITRKNLPPIRDRLDLVEDKAQIVPGLECVLTPGHTPGGLMLMLSSGKDKLCCIGDLIHHELELKRPDLFAIFDVDKDEAVAARKRILPELADCGMLIFSCHFGFPGLGRIVRDGKRLSWKPISMPAA